MAANPTPSPARILATDYTAFLATLLPILLAVLVYFARPVYPSEVSAVFLTILLAAWGAAIPILAWRVRSIQAVFKDGLVLPGTVRRISFLLDRMRIEVCFHYQGKEQDAYNDVFKSRRTLRFHAGDEVSLAVDPENPRRAFLRDLYL